MPALTPPIERKAENVDDKKTGLRRAVVEKPVARKADAEKKDITEKKGSTEKKEDAGKKIMKKVAKKQLTEDELQKKTKNFVIVRDLSSVRTGDYVRYVTIDGAYHQGGFVLYNKEQKICIGTSMGFYTRFKWVVKYNTVKSMFIRMQAESLVLAHELDELTKTTTVIFEYLAKKEGKPFIEYVKKHAND